jgi:hypothetical protein
MNYALVRLRSRLRSGGVGLLASQDILSHFTVMRHGAYPFLAVQGVVRSSLEATCRRKVESASVSDNHCRHDHFESYGLVRSELWDDVYLKQPTVFDVST